MLQKFNTRLPALQLNPDFPQIRNLLEPVPPLIGGDNSQPLGVLWRQVNRFNHDVAARPHEIVLLSDPVERLVVRVAPRHAFARC